MNEEKKQLKELLEAAQNQSRLRDELLSRHSSLAREVAQADVRHLARAASLVHVVATALLLAGPSLLVQACTLVPDGRSMRTELDRTQLIHNANQIIEQL